MRLEKEVKIEREGDDPLLVTVFEIRPKEVFDLLPKNASGESFKATLDKVLPLCSTLSMEAFEGLYPSEQKQLLDAFKEVNGPFLEMAGQIGLGPVVESLRRSLVNDLLSFATGLLPPGTATASTTGGGGSSAPSTP